MDELKQKAIERHFAHLVSNMDPLPVMDHFRAGVLSSTEKDFIKESYSTRRDRNRELLSILYRKRDELEPFECFLEALAKTDTNHEFMAKDILKTYKHENGATEFPKVSRITSLSSDGETQHCLHMVQKSLKEMYLQRFRKTNPFSLPFTFDIENTWVSLALKEYTEEDEDTDTDMEKGEDREEGAHREKETDDKCSHGTQDYVELLQNAFAEEKMLIIEGKPAMGKTSLMRRLAYDWANEKQELSHFDLIIYAEFGEVREQVFEIIVDIVLDYTKNYIEEEDLTYLKSLLSNRGCCKQQNILILLDAYDESSLDKQCKELTTYLTSSVLKKPLTFNIVLTTRPGYLSKFRRQQGRFIFAEVLGFTTKEQKRKYISNHFSSSKKKSDAKLKAVQYLLDNNQNLTILSQTPLFLTFICLVHERIVDDALLELYCNIIWWLIDRHQKNYIDQNIPALFEFQDSCGDTFETIQEHYLRFPQLLSLGNMALSNLLENVFKPTDCAQFNLQPIIEQVGLLRKQKKHDSSLKLITSFFFPHRTIQEFLAAFYCFCSNDPTSKWLLPNSKINTSQSKMNEFERFILRIALSEKMPINTEKRKYYFERIANIKLDITFDAFNTKAGFNNKLLNWFLSQCTNVKIISLSAKPNDVKNDSNILNDRVTHNVSTITPRANSTMLLSFSDLKKLYSVTFKGYALGFSVGTGYQQLSFTNCTSLKILKFIKCEMKSSTNLGITALSAVNTVEFDKCKTDLATWQSIINQIGNSSVKCLKISFGGDFSKEFLIHLQKCNKVDKIEIIIRNFKIRQNELLSFNDLMKLHSLSLGGRTFEDDSQLSFINCPFLKNLKFSGCAMKSSTNLGFAALTAVDSVEFYECKFDLATWQSITDQIRNSSIKCLKLSFGRNFIKEFLIHLLKCNNVGKMEITIDRYTVYINGQLPFTDLMSLHLLTFENCTFEANSQLSFANCPSMKNLIFVKCELKGSTNLGMATLSAIKTVKFYRCNIDLETWQSITDQIRSSSVKCLKLTFREGDFNTKFLIHLQKCSNVEKMEITIDKYTVHPNDQLSFTDLMNLHSLTFENCTFEVHSQLSFSNFSTLKNLQFKLCGIVNSTNLNIATLSAIDAVEFRGCEFDLATWQSIAGQIENSSVRCLGLSADLFVKETYPEFLHHLQKCKHIQYIYVEDIYVSKVNDNILNSYEEAVTKNLVQTAQKLPELVSIIILNEYGKELDEWRRLKEENKKRIEKAGQDRNPDFSIRYVKES